MVVLADLVGDIIGSMGSDMFGSITEAISACMVLGSQIAVFRDAGASAILFPIILCVAGAVISMLVNLIPLEAPQEECSDHDCYPLRCSSR